MRTFILTGGIAILLFAIPACTKYYCCYAPLVTYNCVNGTDTTSTQIVNLGSNVSDSLSYYSSKGFRCTFGYTSAVQQACVKGDAQKKNAEQSGLSCNNDSISSLQNCGMAGYCGEAR